MKKGPKANVKSISPVNVSNVVVSVPLKASLFHMMGHVSGKTDRKSIGRVRNLIKNCLFS